MINKYIDFKALDIKSLSFNGVILSNVKKQLQIEMNSNLKRSTSRNSLLKNHCDGLSKKSSFIQIVLIWKTYHMRISKKFANIHVGKSEEEDVNEKKNCSEYNTSL